MKLDEFCLLHLQKKSWYSTRIRYAKTKLSPARSLAHICGWDPIHRKKLWLGSGFNECTVMGKVTQMRDYIGEWIEAKGI